MTPFITQDGQLIAERLFTIKTAAVQLGLPYWKLNRATKLGLVPSYQLLNTRKLVKLSDIHQALSRIERNVVGCMPDGDDHE